MKSKDYQLQADQIRVHMYNAKRIHNQEASRLKLPTLPLTNWEKKYYMGTPEAVKDALARVAELAQAFRKVGLAMSGLRQPMKESVEALNDLDLVDHYFDAIPYAVAGYPPGFEPNQAFANEHALHL